MLDIKFIRENKEKIKQNIINRKMDPQKADVDALLELDEEYRKKLTEVENIRAERNNLTAGKDEAIRAKGKELKEKLKTTEESLEEIKTKMDKLAVWIPNLMSDDTPIGKSEDDNIDIRVWTPEKGYLDKSLLGKGFEVAAQMPKSDFPGKDHIELGKDLDIIDVEQSALTSGSRFCYLKKEAVILQFAIIDLLFKELLRRNFMPMVVPLMVRERVLFGTSHFPEGYDQVYKISDENVEDKNKLFLVGSSEPSLFGYGMDKRFSEKDMPFKMCSLSSCFRSEVGSWGKDVRGIKRVHQFDKLEMDVICLPEQADEIFEELVSINEWLLQQLKMPYRVIQKCTGDAGYAASHKQYDVETWRIAANEFMETMTDTNATDFQARRLNIRYQKNNNEKGYCYTVNDTGVALGRMILAVLENYQQKDGSILIPEVLQKYCGFSKIEKK